MDRFYRAGNLLRLTLWQMTADMERVEANAKECQQQAQQALAEARKARRPTDGIQ